ncbi:cupin domain-containing protein [bacterium]|nr:cupin domain-containing protein [bacterium]
MLIKDIAHLPHVQAADHAELREILHPERDDVALRCSLAVATIAQGKRSIPHRLATAEVYYVLSGVGMMHLGDEKKPVHPGQAIYIPPGRTQWIENTGRLALTFLCIVDPAWREEDEGTVA